MKDIRIKILTITFLFGFVFATSLNATMMGGNGGTGMMGGGGGPLGSSMMGNSSSFGMMSGMAGAPVVDDRGIAYLITNKPVSGHTTTPASNSFESGLIAVDTDGNVTELALKGIISKPLVSGNFLLVSASLPDVSGYTISDNYATANAKSVSALYVFTLPLSSTSVPQVIKFDGGFASVPIVENNHIYVTTTDFGNAMMQGNNMFNSKFENYNFNKKGTAKTYLYILNFDWTLASKTVIKQ